jgi:hypothetical protein
MTMLVLVSLVDTDFAIGMFGRTLPERGFVSIAPLRSTLTLINRKRAPGTR